MKLISSSVFLTSLADGLDSCIYYFNEDKTLSKTISKNLEAFKSISLLSKSKRKKYLNSPHPIIKSEDKSFNGENIRIEKIYTPIKTKSKKEGLLWLFFIKDKDMKFSQNQFLRLDENLMTMISTLSEVFTSLIDMEEITEINSLYSQSTAFISNLISGGIMLYDKRDNLLFYNTSAEKMNIHNVGSDKLSNDKILNISNNEFYLGNKLIGKIKYTPIQNNLKSNLEYRRNTIKSLNKIIGKNSGLNKVLSIVNQVALTDGTVLIRGESGTGKEEYAKLIHNLSSRRNSPFVALNCAAIPENLLESELFGYEGGSFTGAKSEGKSGRFEIADTGTLFLDEIGDMPLSVQVKLLRVLQDRCIEPVGSNKVIPIDVRIICATHQNLEDKIAIGEFREDLFYRINVIPIDIPSLSDRSDDIELLLTYYLKKYCILQNKGFMTFSYDAVQTLKSYHWQGNIRELINVVEYCVTMSNKSNITISDLPKYINTHKHIKFQRLRKDNTKKTDKPNKEELLELINQFGNSTKGKKKLAKHLNISLATLYRWISKNN